MSPELWEWKYVHNPFAQRDPEVVVALDRGRVVGARPLLDAQLWINDRKVKAAQPCDTMVHPEYRRKALFSKMNEIANAHSKAEGCALFYNFPNLNSRPGYLKQGWRLIAIMEQIIKPRKAVSYRLESTTYKVHFAVSRKIFSISPE